MSFIRLIFSFASMIVPTSVAFADGDKPSCDFEALTNNCSMFSPSGEYKIPLPDGTYIPNVTALSDAADKAGDQSKAVMKRELDSAEAENRARALRVVQILDQIPSSKMNAQLKFTLANNTSILGMLFDEWGAQPPGPVTLPWPPNSSRAKEQSIDPNEARNKLMPLFTLKQRNQLIQIKNNKATIDINSLTADMFRARHPLTDEMNTITPQRRQRVDELVKYVRERIIDNLVGNKPESQWTDAELAAVEKIKAIQYRSGDSSQVRNKAECLGVVPNAFYEAGRSCSNQIIIATGEMAEQGGNRVPKDKKMMPVCLHGGRYGRTTEESFRRWYVDARTVFGL